MSNVSNKLSSTPMIVVASVKGGTGKSAITKGVIDTAVALNLSVVLIEGDAGTPDVVRTYTCQENGKTVPKARTISAAYTCDFNTDDGVAAIAGIMRRHPDACIIVNTPGTKTEDLLNATGQISAEAREAGRTLAMLWPINRERETLENLAQWAAEGRDGFDALYVLKNLHWGASPSFEFYESVKDGIAGITDTLLYPALSPRVAAIMANEYLTLTESHPKMDAGSRFLRDKHRQAVHKSLEGILK
jgi:hypothetical protein